MNEQTDQSDDEGPDQQVTGTLAIRLLRELAQYDPVVAARMRELGLDPDSDA